MKELTRKEIFQNILRNKIICISLFSKVNPMKELFPSLFLFLVGISGISLLWSNGLSDVVNERNQKTVFMSDGRVIKTKAMPLTTSDSSLLVSEINLEIKSDSLQIVKN